LPVNDFLPAHLKLDDNNATTVPSLLVYLLNIFSKAVVAAFVGECAVNLKAAEPIGTLVAQIFSMPELQIPRDGTGRPGGAQSLIPILMCKFHATAPILFGISGSESTATGRSRLGWRRDNVGDAADGKRAFTLPEKHYDRLTGLGVGYASIALRNFSKTKMQNPWPPVHFWASLAHVINTPAQEVQVSHIILLKNMLENNAVDRFILSFGVVGIAALRHALLEFPKTLPQALQEKQATKALQLMVEGWRKEHHFSLT
jgi:nucleoporin GLE1